MPVTKFTNNTEDVSKAIARDSIRGMLLGAELLATNIKKETPVKTGRLRASIQPVGRVERSGGKFVTAVASDVEYGPYIEFGTETIEPRAMFRKGGDKSVKSVERVISGVLPKNNSDI